MDERRQRNKASKPGLFGEKGIIEQRFRNPMTSQSPTPIGYTVYKHYKDRWTKKKHD